MFKYIVTYIIITMQFIPCPAKLPTVDEFGRTNYPIGQTSEACYKRDTAKMSKEFIDRRLALEFIQRGQDKKSLGWMPEFNSGNLDNFKLDSVKLKRVN